nr:MAG TPA: hypothetical protein [Caudoviricetes sp.]
MYGAGAVRAQCAEQDGGTRETTRSACATMCVSGAHRQTEAAGGKPADPSCMGV